MCVGFSFLVTVGSVLVVLCPFVVGVLVFIVGVCMQVQHNEMSKETIKKKKRLNENHNDKQTRPKRPQLEALTNKNYSR